MRWFLLWGGVDEVLGEHGHPGGLLLLAFGTLLGFHLRMQAFFTEELDDGRLLGLGAHVLQREADRFLLQNLTAR
jgi:hypothetical protein